MSRKSAKSNSNATSTPRRRTSTKKERDAKETTRGVSASKASNRKTESEISQNGRQRSRARHNDGMRAHNDTRRDDRDYRGYGSNDGYSRDMSRRDSERSDNDRYVRGGEDNYGSGYPRDDRGRRPYREERWGREDERSAQNRDGDDGHNRARDYDFEDRAEGSNGRSRRDARPYDDSRYEGGHSREYRGSEGSGRDDRFYDDRGSYDRGDQSRDRQFMDWEEDTGTNRHGRGPSRQSKSGPREGAYYARSRNEGSRRGVRE